MKELEGYGLFEIAAVVHVLIETDHKHIILFYDRFCGTRMRRLLVKEGVRLDGGPRGNWKCEVSDA